MGELAGLFRDLVTLDRLDAEWWRCRQELVAKPKELAAEQAAADAQTAAADALAAELAATRKRVASGEADLASTEKRLGRARKRMSTLVTSTQIEATEREIATLGAEAEALEEAILEGMEEVEGLEERLAAQRSAAADAHAALAEHRAAWAARKAELEARSTQLEDERAPIEGGLRADAARRYKVGWRLGRFQPPSGITSVDGYVCVTCRNRVSPLWVQRARSWDALNACDTCKRIIAFDPDAPPPKKEEEEPADAG